MTVIHLRPAQEARERRQKALEELEAFLEEAADSAVGAGVDECGFVVAALEWHRRAQRQRFLESMRGREPRGGEPCPSP